MSAASALRRFFNQAVSVETLAGSGAYGDSYAAPTPVACYVEDGEKLVRNNQGEEVISTTTLFTALENAAAFVANSRVTVNDRVAKVIAAKPRTAGSAGLPDHLEVHLT